jgi:multicomponent Na+:H+ antiporter subunit D
MTAAQALCLIVATPFIGAILIGLSHGKPNQREGVTLVAAVALILQVVSILPASLRGEPLATPSFTILPSLSVQLVLEPLGMIFAAVASFLWLVNSIYSIGYMRGNAEPRQTLFYVWFAIAIGATMGVALSGNLFTLFLFYELLTICTYPLVTHKATKEAVRAGRLYLGTLLGLSIVFLVPAIVWTAMVAGTLDFRPGGILDGKLAPVAMSALLALFVFGIGKAAVMPVHRWLPAAMVAPTPVSALLHAVAVVKAGVFSILKIVVYVFGIDVLSRGGASEWLVIVAGATVILASLVAWRQDNLKRRLAYSTVSQLSYVVLAAAVLTPISAIGGALHIAAHAFGKITLFFAAGSIYTAAHKTEVSELGGIGRHMPWTMGAFAVATLSIIGIPPTVGFLGKWYLLSGAVSSGQWLAVAVIVLSTVLNAAYLAPIVYAAFARGAGEHAHREAPLPMVIATTASAIGTVALFFAADIPLRLARQRNRIVLGRASQ